MTYDPDKALNITYNHLNLPSKFQFPNNDRIEVLYDAAGSKLQQKVYDNNVLISTKNYIGGVEYQDGTIEATYHAEGRVYFFTNDAQVFTHRHEYAIKDHLGNIRLWVSDLDNDGILEMPSEILQEKHYYPFGMVMEGPWMESSANPVNKYQYNGKELHTEFGLNLMDYGARWYDAAVGRWWSVDPLAEDYMSWSGYNYVMNNPMKYIDPDGKGVHLAIDTDKNGNITITISATIYMYGSKATNELANKFQKRINNDWSGNFNSNGNNFTVKSNISVKNVSEGEAKKKIDTYNRVGKSTPDVNFLRVFDSNESNTASKTDGNVILLNLNQHRNSGNTTLSHEVGHLMNFKNTSWNRSGLTQSDGIDFDHFHTPSNFHLLPMMSYPAVYNAWTGDRIRFAPRQMRRRRVMSVDYRHLNKGKGILDGYRGVRGSQERKAIGLRFKKIKYIDSVR